MVLSLSDFTFGPSQSGVAGQKSVLLASVILETLAT